MITAKLDNKIVKTKAYKKVSLGGYEYAWVKVDGWWLKLRRRIGNKYFVFYEALPNQDKKFSVNQ